MEDKKKKKKIKNFKKEKNSKNSKLIYLFTSLSLFLNVVLCYFYFKKSNNYITDPVIIKNETKTDQINTDNIDKINIDNIDNIINKIITIEKEEPIYDSNKEIHIATAIDEDNIYPLIVSMTSAIENCKKGNVIGHYYILMKDNLSDEKLLIIKSIKNKYKENCKLNIYYMSNLFNSYKNSIDYYKLLLSRLLPNLEVLIYLDKNTLVYNSIKDMYKVKFQNYFILGFPVSNYDYFDKLNIYSVLYINTGVMLMNLTSLRYEDIDKQLIKYCLNNNNKMNNPVDDSINYILYPNAGPLPFKYGISIQGSIDLSKTYYLDKIRTRPNLKELESAILNPSIVHFIESEPNIWFKNAKHIYGNKFDEYIKKFQKDFYNFAEKTDYFNEIMNKYLS